jgi:hypothetical protein
VVHAGVKHRTISLCLSVVVALLIQPGCRERPQPAPKDVVIWHQVGSWAGRGNKQTETFTSDTGGFRVHWTTTNEQAPGAGTLKVIFRSADSGREIIEAVDAHGVDSDVAVVAAERPRWYYLTIESASVDWSVTVDERVGGRVESRP